MPEDQQFSYKYTRIEQHFSLDLGEICHSCGVTREWIETLLLEGIIQPSEDESGKQRLFDAEAIRRLKTAIRLHHDLGINPSGIALVLDLLDEIDELKSKIYK